MKRKALGLAALLCVAFAVTAASAYGHYTWVYHGQDIAIVIEGHSGIYSCDEENDGHFVRAHTRNVTGQIHVHYRTYGPGQCSQISYYMQGQIEFRLCEEVVGCTDWRYV